MNLLHDWMNGNVNVKLFDEGTKIRSYEDVPLPEYPETIDMKITNWCNAPCQKWCHEQSNIQGLHADPDKLSNVLSSAVPGMEIAFGGGATQMYPALAAQVRPLVDRGVVCNMTVNQYHIESTPWALLDMFRGIGVSFQANQSPMEIVRAYERHPHVVVHMIMGIHTPQQARDLAHDLQYRGFKLRLLLLGYKNWGNGSRYKSLNDLAVEKCLGDWYREIGHMIRDMHIGFDNLAIEQMRLSRLFTPEGWSKFYMGNEGTFSMYIDMVKEEYASHSTSPDRYPVNGQSIRDMFQHIRQLEKEKALV